tara:strand:- start:259 stop:438 length:180 start_codon:yes stop_codon:yes gene_type:complete
VISRARLWRRLGPCRNIYGNVLNFYEIASVRGSVERMGQRLIRLHFAVAPLGFGCRNCY